MATLDTPRLRLRPLGSGDQALYLALYTDAETLRFVTDPQSPDAAARGFRAACRMNLESPPRRRFWVMQPRDGSDPVGLLGLAFDEPGGAEVGAVILPAHQGRGHATEAIAALADFAFGTLGLQRLHTRHAAGHGLAEGLMSGLGFEATARADGAQGWRWQLTPAAWARRQATRDGDKPAVNPLT